MMQINSFRRLIIVFSLLLVVILRSYPQASPKTLTITLDPGEKIWTGVINQGNRMPLSAPWKFDFYANNDNNQLMPLLISNKGLYVWSEEPYSFEFKDNQLVITDPYNSLKTGRQGKTLADVRGFVSQSFFPPSGKMPDSMLFARPQYNTWIELGLNQNQDGILKYARGIIKNNLPPGVLMIDGGWEEDWGLLRFHPGRFPDPKSMMDELHRMGFKVMVWVSPFVSPDQTLLYMELKKMKAFLLEKKKSDDTWEKVNEPIMIRWWCGVSAEYDFTNPVAVKWFTDQLNRLVSEFGVDGFKFDAGDMQYYPQNALSFKQATPNLHCQLYTQFGLLFPMNEYRACWKSGGQPLGQRLLDKYHSWEDLQKLIPNMVVEGLSGYTFSCPDLIAGGMLPSFKDWDFVDQDLFVRSAQCHSLMPMMQFSLAPWRVLDEQHMEAIKKSVSVRTKFMTYIMDLVHKSAQSGDPILSNLEYYFPNQGLEMVVDQFMMGNKLLVAPMVSKGKTRNVILPKGKWRADDGKVYEGGKTYSISVPLDRLPYFELM
jgi:alpha-glucosidase (family GH31 glycosyl hydrolase)